VNQAGFDHFFQIEFPLLFSGQNPVHQSQTVTMLGDRFRIFYPKPNKTGSGHFF
jgi:hypothetical protein